MLPPLCINLDILVQRGGKMFLLNTLRMNANPFSAPSVAGNAFSWIAFYMRTWQKCGEEERKWRQIWWPNVYVNCCGRYFCQLMHTFHTCLLLCLTRWNKEFSHWCGASKKKKKSISIIASSAVSFAKLLVPLKRFQHLITLQLQALTGSF